MGNGTHFIALPTKVRKKEKYRLVQRLIYLFEIRLK